MLLSLLPNSITEQVPFFWNMKSLKNADPRWLMLASRSMTLRWYSIQLLTSLPTISSQILPNCSAFSADRQCSPLFLYSALAIFFPTHRITFFSILFFQFHGAGLIIWMGRIVLRCDLLTTVEIDGVSRICCWFIFDPFIVIFKSVPFRRQLNVSSKSLHLFLLCLFLTLLGLVVGSMKLCS